MWYNSDSRPCVHKPAPTGPTHTDLAFGLRPPILPPASKSAPGDEGPQGARTARRPPAPVGAGLGGRLVCSVDRVAQRPGRPGLEGALAGRPEAGSRPKVSFEWDRRRPSPAGGGQQARERSPRPPCVEGDAGGGPSGGWGAGRGPGGGPRGGGWPRIRGRCGDARRSAGHSARAGPSYRPVIANENRPPDLERGGGWGAGRGWGGAGMGRGGDGACSTAGGGGGGARRGGQSRPMHHPPERPYRAI